MCDYMVLPLLNSSFEPGKAREVVEGFVDVDVRNIARAELFYFTGQAEELVLCQDLVQVKMRFSSS